MIDLSMIGIKSRATRNIKMQKAGARRELLLLRFLPASDLERWKDADSLSKSSQNSEYQ